MKLQYLSHSAFLITTDENIRIVIDPFLDHNPNAPFKSDKVTADYVVLTHAHGDHIGDAFKIGKRCGSLFICVNELADYCAGKGFKVHNMHVGGGYRFPFGRIEFTIAHHSSVTPDGVYAGPAAGVLITDNAGKTIYHAGDTGLFYDMKLIGEMNKLSAALLPIGDNFTMGIRSAVKAVEFLRPELTIPMHYNTFEPIKADPEEFKKLIDSAGFKCRVMAFGEEIII